VAWYVDSSAVLELLVAQAESSDVRAWWPEADVWSSELLITEVHRAAARLGVSPGAVDAVLDTVNLLAPTRSTFAAAGQLRPTGLRTLDAIHIAAALELTHDLDGLVTYDIRQAGGADAAGIAVVSPGRPDHWWE
jgi:uncharacterized protein